MSTSFDIAKQIVNAELAYNLAKQSYTELKTQHDKLSEAEQLKSASTLASSYAQYIKCKNNLARVLKNWSSTKLSTQDKEAVLKLARAYQAIIAKYS